ncbi:MAG: Sua5/YciO/YrdC/YwlC family protein [Paludibacter sp.]
MINSTDKPDFRIDISKAIESLQAGGFIQFNSEFGWLTACDTSNEACSKKLFDLKEKHSNWDLFLLVDSTSRIQSYVEVLPDIVWDLFEISEKPLTIILDGIKNMASEAIKNNNIGFRISNETFATNLCSRMRKPLLCITPDVIVTDNELSNTIYKVTYRSKEKFKPVLPSIIKLGIGNEIKIIRK